MQTIIFDFDGTIADTFPIACDIVRQNAKYLSCKQLSLTEIKQLRNLHILEVLNYLGIPKWRAPIFMHKLRKLAKIRVDEIKIFPGCENILAELSHTNQLGIVSSNSSTTIEYVLTKYDLHEYFSFIYCNKPLFSKTKCLKKLIKKNLITPINSYYIGDEVRDIEAAKNVHINSIAVSWGFTTKSRLKESEPTCLVDNFTELMELFKY